MTTQETREDGTLVLLVHLTLKPGHDVALIQLVRSAPRRLLARRVREAMHKGLTQPIKSNSEGKAEHHD